MDCLFIVFAAILHIWRPSWPPATRERLSQPKWWRTASWRWSKFAYSVFSRLHSIRGGLRLVRLRREKHKSACCIMLYSHMFDTWWAWLWSFASVATRVHGSVGHRLVGGLSFGARRDGKTKRILLKSEALL